MILFLSVRRLVTHALFLLCASNSWAQSKPQVPTTPTSAPTVAPVAQPLSHDAQRAYEGARDKLVQIRTLLRNSDTQASVGSGFFVSGSGLIITNFHVASQIALEPERYRGVYVPVDGKEAPVQLLAFDVQHDLALLRVQEGGNDHPALDFRAQDKPLARGERIYSLGNPKDIGFAVTEGTYNGLVQRSFYPRIFFGGAINPGMSGGPVLDDNGKVIGINVSKLMDGEQLSFLVPAEFALTLIARAPKATPMTKPAHAEVTRQLLAHQELLTQRFVQTPLRAQKYVGYSLPLPDDGLARCWGNGRDADKKAFNMERTDCQLDSYVFAGEITTGFIHLRYDAYDAPKFSALRFANLQSAGFRNLPLDGAGSAKMTAAECSERYIDRGGMAMRAVVCMSAYRKLVGLYDMSVLVVSLNRPTQGVQGRLDAHGVSFANGLKLAAQYLDAFKWEAQP